MNINNAGYLYSGKDKNKYTVSSHLYSFWFYRRYKRNI